MVKHNQKLVDKVTQQFKEHLKVLKAKTDVRKSGMHKEFDKGAVVNSMRKTPLYGDTRLPC